MDNIYPGAQWTTVTPEKAGFDGAALAETRRWQESQGDTDGWRVVVVRHGRLVLEWNHGKNRTETTGLASAAKAVLSTLLGIAVAEGKIASPDDRLVQYYPEAMDVPPGAGPKEGRHVFEKDRAITLRQLLSNTSGYMKPDEEPGQVFHYQTYGMNVTGHAIAKAYATYDVEEPDTSPNLQPLYTEKIANPICANWEYRSMNFNLHAKARLHIFGYGTGVFSSALDMARLGWLWCQEGEWAGRQVAPAAWLHTATRVAAEIRANCPPEDWKYGYGFWTNETGRLWPGLPKSSYAAVGAGNRKIWVWPEADLVVIEGPGLPAPEPHLETELLQRVVDALA